jgi:hypothetical protein
MPARCILWSVVSCQLSKALGAQRDRAPETGSGDPEVARSPLLAHPASALWYIRAVALPLPFSLTHLRAARGLYRAHPDVVINSGLHSAERPPAACEA